MVANLLLPHDARMRINMLAEMQRKKNSSLATEATESPIKDAAESVEMQSSPPPKATTD